tara:strand:+ start:258 stop:659 length:402 start_codon:yes stop_codon:yes gene_type:complete
MVDENIYNIKIPLKEKNKIIEQFNLNGPQETKEYWINNVCILSDKNSRQFYYINDKEIQRDEKNKMLIHNFDKCMCKVFSFFHVDSEEEYLLYTNEIDNVIVSLKEFNDYLTLDFNCKELSTFNSLKNINNII